MKTIKKYWIAIVAALGAIFAIFVFASTKHNKNKVAKTDDAIKQNDADINKAEGHIEEIQEQREQKVEEVKQTETEIAELKDAAKEIKPDERTVEAAKENILKKTRRGRPKKS